MCTRIKAYMCTRIKMYVASQTSAWPSLEYCASKMSNKYFISSECDLQNLGFFLIITIAFSNLFLTFFYNYLFIDNFLGKKRIHVLDAMLETAQSLWISWAWARGSAARRPRRRALSDLVVVPHMEVKQIKNLCTNLLLKNLFTTALEEFLWMLSRGKKWQSLRSSSQKNKTWILKGCIFFSRGDRMASCSRLRKACHDYRGGISSNRQMLEYSTAQFRQFYQIVARDRVRRLADLFRDIRIRCKQK